MSQGGLTRAFVAGFGAFLALVGLVFATGATFGQRCERYFPNGSELTIALCVEHLGGGGSVADLAQGIEARQGGDAEGGSVHESPVAEGHAPNPDSSPVIGRME